ncbi:MAG: pyridoxamine 5'-phosphate oxidase [Actinomycetota bacterium]|nr:pyridoxamine 5'-phosphate oxidase [Actinomycetota bacterium]
MDISKRRREYEEAGIDTSSVLEDPIDQFKLWYQEAQDGQIPEPDAAVIASVNEEEYPSSRFVLVRKVDADGFVFFTNYRSDKATSFSLSPKVSLTFGWLPLHRQVRVHGLVEVASAKESDEYFAQRPRGHQIGAWASPQGQVIPDRQTLVDRYGEIINRFGNGPIPRPDHWGGYRIRPTMIEFWQGRPDRLHDRLRYSRHNDRWLIERLAP